MLRRFSETKLATDIKGAALIYVSLMMALLVGMAGVAIDMSRLSVAHTQAQAAADAAALAAARQLDGSIDSITRARAAAEGALLVANSQQFSDEADSSPNVQVTLRFIQTLPADDDDPITDYTTVGRNAYFAEATTEILTHDNLLLPALGVAMSKNYVAVAVAGQDSASCKFTQFAICNPGETATDKGFDYTDWQGKLIRVRQSGAGAAWAPGNFGYLDPPSGQTGAGDIADFLAAVDTNDQCFANRLNTRTGQIIATRNALNTRFDVYENPFFQPGGGMNDPRVQYPPAQNVTKGWTPVPSAGMSPTDPCVLEVDPNLPAISSGLPLDNNQVGNETEDFGTGEWDCLTYWALNHPDDPTALGPNADGLTCANASDAVSRYEIYKWEIENNEIPGAATTHAGEEGYPQCSSSGPAQTAPYDYSTDRRIVRFAIMNCIAENVRGNTDGVPALAIVDAFLTQPIPGPTTYDVFLEVIDVVETGTNSGELKEYVEIYR